MTDSILQKRLADGTEVLLRGVRPEDRALISAGFEQFSEASRYRRFFMQKNELSEAELRYLTEVDGFHHDAVGALAVDEAGRDIPLGIARFVRLTDEQDVAEAAVAVVDAMQGKGLGKLLIHALSDAAYAQGIRRFRCMVLADNAAIHKVLLELDPHARVVRRESDVRELELELPAPGDGGAAPGPRQKLERLVQLAAQRLVAARPFARERAGTEKKWLKN